MTTITGYQVVQAEKRGDKCYADKKGWYWHALDKDSAIIESSVTGPFDTVSEATLASLNARD